MSFIVLGAVNETPHSVVVICPAERRDEALALAEFGLSGPLAPKGLEPVTHYALHTFADDATVEMMRSAGLTVSLARDLAPRGHIDEVLKGSGLRKLAPVKGIMK